MTNRSWPFSLTGIRQMTVSFDAVLENDRRRLALADVHDIEPVLLCVRSMRVRKAPSSDRLKFDPTRLGDPRRSIQDLK
jgi:hypothetical protein